ncbi:MULTISPECIES: Lrp/AsnC family transcriptional regulator [unclassified Halorhabdus]|uniref:Lrp/AsnC family transcriptional regulator n=1 Tax=unclassified Halorhabdus TaxID=2621901 RepID=UPI0023DC98DE|nr:MULTISPECIES: Lrp/AsnC family transcriptional regulator [unclassified Halorhabdus]WEL16452.1 DNA-binding transcriptional regulator, Lrp family [Halorhabdus sp. SVX81]WEL20334.1 DNA-binding transcriptional regulator, Lrp family [Halorhabdus sp. BNX81]
MDPDDIDHALVDALLEDGRASIQDLATEAGVAVETAERRIEALEDAGVIQGYTATIDYDELGYDVTAVVRLRVGGSIEALSETLEAYSWARSAYEVTGEDDFLLVGRFLDTDDMHEKVAELLTEPSVRSVTVDVAVDELRRFEPMWLGDADA